MAESKGAVIAAMVANGGIAVTKFIAAAFSGSSAMFAEGIHSVVDTGNQAFMLLGLKRATKPADETHPFGYGAELYFWAFIVAVLLFSLGSGLSIWEGVRALLHGEAEHEGVPWLPYGVLAIAFALESYAFTTAAKQFQKKRAGRGLWQDLKDTKDPAIFVVLAEDAAALTGILVAAAGLTLSWYTSAPVWDAVASIVIGIVLGITAIFLANEVRKLLIGEAADPRIVRAIHERLSNIDEVSGVNEIRSVHFGPDDILFTISLDFRDDVKAGRIEHIVSETEIALKKDFPEVQKVFLEVQSKSGHDQATQEARP